MSVQNEVQPWDRANRDQKILEQYARGLRASTIARQHKLTASRVRQILHAAGKWRGTKS